MQCRSHLVLTRIVNDPHTQIILHPLCLEPSFTYTSILVTSMCTSVLFLGSEPSTSPADTALILLRPMNIPNSTDTRFMDSSGAVECAQPLSGLLCAYDKSNPPLLEF